VVSSQLTLCPRNAQAVCEDTPRAARCAARGSRGRSTPTELQQSLWLWPLPAPDRAATVRIDWADYRISGAKHPLDVEAMLAAADRVRPFF
jgi:hypothetical protein